MLGSVVHIIGDSQAGKSLLALTMMAEAVKDPRLKNYNLTYEEPESALYFDCKAMFGEGISKVAFIPKDEERVNPRRVQDWANDLIKAKHPFLWVTDSFDSLTSADDLKRDESGKGGWKTEKAIVASETFPKFIGPLKASNSLYCHISQTRDNIGVTFGESKTFSGGNAIKFYRCHEIWLAVTGKITVSVRGKDRVVGHHVLAQVKKNKLTGKIRQIAFDVFDSYGVDDIGSIIDWLVTEKFWTKEKQTILAEEPFVDGTRSKIIKHVEECNLEEKLRDVARECWLDLENEINIRRKPRY